MKTTLLRLSSPPDKHVSDHLFHNITEYTEVRQDWSVVPRGWGAYHSFTLLHVQGNELTICLEKKTDKLEIMLAHGARATRFLEDFSALIRPRNPERCAKQPRLPVAPGLSVARLFEWIDGPLARNWQPYSLTASNCQHFAEELHNFLRNPLAVERETEDKAVTQLTATIPKHVEIDPQVLTRLPQDYRKERCIVLRAVQANGLALEFAGEQFQQDWRVVLAAVKQDGEALQYAAPELRADKEVVLAAVSCKGSALRYADKSLKSDKEILLQAGWHGATTWVSNGWGDDSPDDVRAVAR